MRQDVNTCIFLLMDRQEQPLGQAVATAVGTRVRRYRTERGLSAQALADRCEQLGYELKRSVIAEMENGKRATVSVADVLVLARALRVPPLSLLLDLGAPFDAGPMERIGGWEAYSWMTGQRELWTDLLPWIVDIQEDIEQARRFHDAAEPLRLRREHDRTQSNIIGHKLWVDIYRKREASADNANEKQMLEMLTLRETELLVRSEKALDDINAELRALGVEPPEDHGFVEKR